MLVHVLQFWLILLDAHSYQHLLLTSCRQHCGIICQLSVLPEDSASSKQEQSMRLGTMQIGNVFPFLPLQNSQHKYRFRQYQRINLIVLNRRNKATYNPEITSIFPVHLRTNRKVFHQLLLEDSFNCQRLNVSIWERIFY